MIFLPRAPEKSEEAEETGKIRFRVASLNTKAYELRSSSQDDLAHYRALIDSAGACVTSDEQIYLATEWKDKRNCLIVVTSEIAAKVSCLREKGLDLQAEEILQPPFRLSHEFITDHSEYEAIADLVLECITGIDRFYVCYDWKRKMSCCIYLWATDEPASRQQCAASKDILVEA